MRADDIALLTIFVFLLGLLVGAHVDVAQVQSATDLLLTPLVTLLAAYAGAGYAFKLQADKSKRDLDLLQVQSANRAIFEMSRAYNTLNTIDQQFVDPIRTNRARHFQMKPASGLTEQRIAFDYDSLAFMFRSADPNFLGNLSMLELEVNSTLELLQTHSDIHRKEFQPKIEQAGILQGISMPLYVVEEAAGPRLTHTLKDVTTDLIEGIERDKKDLMTNAAMLRMLAKKIYPEHVIVGLSRVKRTFQLKPLQFTIFDEMQRPRIASLWSI